MAFNHPRMGAFASVLVAVLALGASNAFAQQKMSGFYVGGSAGVSSMLDLSNVCNNTLPARGVTTTTCDNKGFAKKGFAGYQFIRYFGVELGYYDFGKGTIKTASGGNIEFKARGPYAGIVITAPLLDRLSFIGRIGAIRWSTKFNADGASGVASASDNGINGAFGVGLEYMFTDAFGMRAEVERFSTIGDDASTGQTNINMYSVSGLFRF